MKKKLAIVLALLLTLCVSSKHVNVAPKPTVEYKMPYLKRVVVLRLGDRYKAVVFFELPTPCHKVRYEGLTVQGNEFIIDFAYKKPNPGQVCIQVLQKYEKTIDLGRLKRGTYIIVIRVNGKVAKVLKFEVV